MNNCVNHPDKKAISVCHNCGKEYCAECLTEGEEYYYCKKPECQEQLNKGTLPEMPEEITCPVCSAILQLSDEEIETRKIHCSNCEAFMDYNFNPPKVLKSEALEEVFSSLNLGDLAVVKSMLQDANIDYSVFGENFLSTDPLIQPARIVVRASQVEEAKELLKEFEPNIFGISKNNETEDEE
jgi:hypothetical protein